MVETVEVKDVESFPDGDLADLLPPSIEDVNGKDKSRISFLF